MLRKGDLEWIAQSKLYPLARVMESIVLDTFNSNWPRQDSNGGITGLQGYGDIGPIGDPEKLGWLEVTKFILSSVASLLCRMEDDIRTIGRLDISVGDRGINGPMGAIGPEEAQSQADYYFEVKRFLGAVGIIGSQHNQRCWVCDTKSRDIAEFFGGFYCQGKLNPEESCWPELERK